jgi:hypothetical protein
LLDLATYRCDRHYVDYIFATALKTGIHVGNGAVDGQIQNCQFNPSAYTHAGAYYDSIPFNTAGDIHKILWRDATPYRFGHMTNEVLHQNFVFGGAKGFHLVNEGGQGPSGHCLGFGVDQCTVAMQIDAVGSGGLAPINSQIVTVNGTSGRYLETGAALTNTFRMFSSAGWGTHQYSAVINGGDVKLQLFHLARDGETGCLQGAKPGDPAKLWRKPRRLPGGGTSFPDHRPDRYRQLHRQYSKHHRSPDADQQRQHRGAGKSALWRSGDRVAEQLVQRQRQSGLEQFCQLDQRRSGSHEAGGDRQKCRCGADHCHGHRCGR